MQDFSTPRAILEKLVSFPTVSRESNLDLVDWVEEWLDASGIAAHRVWSEDRSKASLYAHVGPEVGGGVILSGHSDVVPVDGQVWRSDPFVLTERDGRLYGRGAVDMKGFDALALWALAEAARDGGLNRPLQLALSHDEEIGCLGAPALIAAMGAHLPKAAAVIVGEPSMMKVVTGHKGGLGFQTQVRGHEVHSSLMHRGVSAIHEAARLIGWANEVNAANAAAAPGPMAAEFDPPWTTLHVGRIEGGTAHNITAGNCRFGFDFRVVPGERMEDWEARFLAKVAEVEAGMKAVHPGAGISLSPFFRVPALRPETGGAAEALARLLTGDNGRTMVSYATEAGQFQQAGHSVVVCGPGDIAQAHQSDEYITLDQLAAGEDFMRRLVASLCG